MKINVKRSKTIRKNWGSEEIICNSEKYCGKIMVLLKDKYCSLHYHKLKEEDFYVMVGRIKLEMQQSDPDGQPVGEKAETILEVGDSVNVKPGMLHRFTGLEPENLFVEFSSQDFAEDSYRIEPSCPAE